MGTRDTRIDAYIAKAADFAKPILGLLRETVHAGCPDVEETIRWGVPSFTYRGLLCSMAAFKQHCTFGLWKGSLVLGRAQRDDAMGHFGRITNVKDLPPRATLLSYVRKAAALNEKGVRVARVPRRPSVPARVPADLAAALRKNRKAHATFDAFCPSHCREYIQWITDAKRVDTRQRRLQTAIAWLAEGKTHNWRYERRRA